MRLEADLLKGMTVEQRITLVQDKIVRYARDLLHFDHFVVRLLHRKTSNKLDVLFAVGMPGDAEQELFANAENNGISGYVAATGPQLYLQQSATTTRTTFPGLVNSRSCLTVPLMLHDKVIGIMNVESDMRSAPSARRTARSPRSSAATSPSR